MSPVLGLGVSKASKRDKLEFRRYKDVFSVFRVHIFCFVDIVSLFSLFIGLKKLEKLVKHGKLTYIFQLNVKGANSGRMLHTAPLKLTLPRPQK